MDTFSDINSESAYIYQKPIKEPFFNKSSLNKFFVVGIALVALSGVGYTTVQLRTTQNVVSQASTQPAQLIVSASKSTVLVGEELTVSILINTNDRPITGAQLYFSYPDEYFEAVEVTNGSFLPDVLAPGTAAAGTGFITIGVAESLAPTGSGVLATIRLKAKKISSKPVEIRTNNEKTKILTSERVAIGVISTSARITIAR